MENSRIELIVKEWFELKTGIELSDETINKIVVDITDYSSLIKQDLFVVANKKTSDSTFIFNSLIKAESFIKKTGYKHLSVFNIRID